jgi:hypothetical protein
MERCGPPDQIWMDQIRLEGKWDEQPAETKATTVDLYGRWWDFTCEHDKTPYGPQRNKPSAWEERTGNSALARGILTNGNDDRRGGRHGQQWGELTGVHKNSPRGHGLAWDQYWKKEEGTGISLQVKNEGEDELKMANGS